MIQKTPITTRITLILVLILTGQWHIEAAVGMEAQEGGYIAGLTPNLRPANAPRIKTVQKDDHWYNKALAGIEPPYPWSLRFLEDQGNWHTPFNHPGMTGHYDIRNWHHHQ